MGFSKQISSLAELRTSSDYAHLKQLVAQHNQLLSLADLYGSKFWKENKPTQINVQFNLITDVRNSGCLSRGGDILL